jgi:hypothetical protein
MRQIVCLLVVFLAFAFGLECVGQVSSTKEVIYGTVRTDGYSKITKGAYWLSRPESKMVYQGATPPGVTVYVLESEYFVRFVDGEFNQNDKNYIVFPKGEKVYVMNGQYYAAICGNRIEYIRPVDMVTIKTIDAEVVEKTVSKTESKQSFSFPEDLGGSTVETKQVQKQAWSYETPAPVRKKFFKRRGVKIGGVVIGVGGVSGILYAILHKGASPNHGEMSKGRPFVDPATVIPIDPGAGRGN